jgi:hypothetical protein
MEGQRAVSRSGVVLCAGTQGGGPEAFVRDVWHMKLELMGRLVAALETYAAAPPGRVLLAGLAELCERAEAQSWIHHHTTRDILQEFEEGVGACARRWRTHRLEFEARIDDVAREVEARALDWARGDRPGPRDERVGNAVAEVREQAQLLRLATADLAESIAREAERIAGRMPFSGAAVLEPVRKVRATALTLARVLQEARTSGVVAPQLVGAVGSDVNSTAQHQQETR